MENASRLPFERVVWMYWQQGLASAPPMVRACVESWIRANPTWDVRVLDATSLTELAGDDERMDVHRRDLDVQKISDWLRLQLLRSYGGVWADATTYCVAPLDFWLPAYIDSGFFAFCRPGHDRLISNWFLASEAGNDLIAELDRRFFRHFSHNRFWLQPTPVGRWVVAQLTPLLGKDVHRTRLWLSLPIRKLLRVYPYFLFHYIFNDVVACGGRPAAIWKATPRIDAAPAHEMQRLAPRFDDLDRALEVIDSRRASVYKLDWRVDSDDPYWAGVLRALGSLSPTC